MVEKINVDFGLLQISSIVIAANIRAIKDIWFIGDHMIREAYPYLQELQRNQEAGYDNYLHANYDTYVFYPNFAENNVLTMIRNGFIEALNKRIKMLSAVVILLSDQLIVEDPLYLPSEIDRKIKWILRELEAAVKIRKSSLPLKAYTFGEPRIMWVRGFQNTRANNVPPELLLKYNNMLRKICMTKAVYTIPVDTYQNSTTRCFDYNGKTKIKGGFDLLWTDIINGIQQHDKNDKAAEEQRLLKAYGRHCDSGKRQSDGYARPRHYDEKRGRDSNYTHRSSSSKRSDIRDSRRNPERSYSGDRLAPHSYRDHHTRERTSRRR